MKKKENGEKDEFKGCKCRAYGMNGVGKQTNSSHDSKKCFVITKLDDEKGIERRVSQNPHHSEELRQRRQGKGSPCGMAPLSTPSFRCKFVTRGTDKAEATAFWRKA